MKSQSRLCKIAVKPPGISTMEVSWFAKASLTACVTCAVAETKHRQHMARSAEGKIGQDPDLHPPPPHRKQTTFRPTEGRNAQWRKANRRRQQQTNQHPGLVPNPPTYNPPLSSGIHLESYSPRAGYRLGAGFRGLGRQGTPHRDPQKWGATR